MTNAKIVAQVMVSKDGSYMVTGRLPLAKQIIGPNADGGSEKWAKGKTYTTPKKIRVMPVRPVEEKAVLRWHPRKDRF
jgi:hypothetical protein